MDSPPITSDGVDTSVPSACRMYDYYLGGNHNFAADRRAAEQVLSIAPWTRDMAISNRAFLGRVVRFLAGECGVRQFLDLGSGVPTVGNVHEEAQAVEPSCRVVYVDIDPVAVATLPSGRSDGRRCTLPRGATLADVTKRGERT